MHQYIAHLLNEFTNEQQLNDPEVEDCFIKFDKVSEITKKQELSTSFIHKAANRLIT